MYGGELPLPHATFVVESMTATLKRNRTYLSRYHNLTRNASRLYFLRSQNITSHQQRLHNSLLAKRWQSYSHSNMLKYGNLNQLSNLVKTHQSRLTNSHQQYYDSSQNRNINTSKFRKSHKKTYSMEAHLRNFNETEFHGQSQLIPP